MALGNHGGRPMLTLIPVNAFGPKHMEWTEIVRFPRHVADMTRLIDTAREAAGKTEACYAHTGSLGDNWKLFVRFVDADAAKQFSARTMDMHTMSCLVLHTLRSEQK